MGDHGSVVPEIEVAGTASAARRQSFSFGRLFVFTGFSRARTGRDPELDVVRGVAILLAIGWHFNYESTGNFLYDLLQMPGRLMGWAGVDLFFVLSGFLIGRMILGEVHRHGKFDFKRFLIRRVFRLWPVLFVFLFAHVLVADRPWNGFLFQTLFSMQNYLGTSIAILWSLAVEEHFYLVIGLLFVCFPRQTCKPRTIFLGLTGILLIAPALRCAAEVQGWDPIAIQWQSQFRMDALAGGVLLAALSLHRPALFDRLTQAKWLLLVGVATGCLVLSNIEFQGAFASTAGYTISYITGGAFLLLVYRSNILNWGRWLAVPLIFLGIYSYPLYVWQFAGLSLANATATRFVLAATPSVRIALSYVFAICVAVFISTLVEQPLMRVGTAMTKKVD